MTITTQSSKRSRFKIREFFINSALYLQLTFAALVVLFPVVWIVGSSFGNTTSLAQSRPIPTEPTISNYSRLINNTDYIQWYKNTLFVAGVNMVFSVMVSTLTSYAFARFSFKGKKAGLISILVLQMFPTFLGMTAIYILFLNFQLLDNLWGLALIYIAGQIPYNTWLMKGYMQNIPKSLDEAALIDGAGKLRIFSSIIIPLAFPMITFLAVSTFMAPWMDYILPRLLISSDSKKTLAIGLYEMINTETNSNFTMFASGAVLVAVPITLLYMSLQRFLIHGITAGASKE